MSSGLNTEQATACQDLAVARDELLAAMDALADGALEKARRGGWSVRRVLQHIIESEHHYARLVAALRGLPPAPPPEGQQELASLADAVQRLDTSRKELLAALDGIDEESFYRLDMVGREEYSVLSVLENVAHHDREHGQQLRSIAATV
jgi:uncharacterized damage-inducible protein DinB